VFLLAGIAGPERFTRAAIEAGYAVAGSWAPGDHYRYTAADVARVARDVESAGAVGVLTTSKDAVRLLPLRPLPFAVYEWPLQVTIEPRDEFAVWLRRRRDQARAVHEARAASA
jgi:tetraacyldisaccharide-1-P 4'-kinase